MEQNQQDKENEENEESKENEENKEYKENEENMGNEENEENEKVNKKGKETIGRKKGSNKIQLTPSNDWPFHQKSKKLLKFLIDEGRHVSLHITHPEKESKDQMELQLEKKLEQEKKNTFRTVLKVYGKFFQDKNSNPKESVIYFFRAPNSPYKSIQETVKALEEKHKVELEKNLEILRKPLSYDFDFEDPNFSWEQYEIYPSAEIINEVQNINQNPFQLKFIDSDLANVLEKIWKLFNIEFLFELVLMFYAKENDLDVTNILLSMETENNNFPEILQNILIKKMLNKNLETDQFLKKEFKLEQFQQKFKQLFEKEDVKKEVKNFCESIYSIVKAKDNENNDQLEPNIRKKVKLQADDDEIVEHPLNQQKLSQGQLLEQQIYENDLGKNQQGDDTLYLPPLRLDLFKFSYGESGNQQYCDHYKTEKEPMSPISIGSDCEYFKGEIRKKEQQSRQFIYRYFCQQNQENQ